MSRSRSILLGGLVVLTVSAVISASASAALQYYIKGGELIKGTLLVDGIGGTQVLKAKAAGAAVTITCSSLDSHGRAQIPPAPPV